MAFFFEAPNSIAVIQNVSDVSGEPLKRLDYTMMGGITGWETSMRRRKT